MTAKTTIDFKDSKCRVRLPPALLHGLPVENALAGLESWVRSCLQVTYQNAVRREQQQLPVLELAALLPMPAEPEFSEESSLDNSSDGEWENEKDAVKTPSKGKAKETFATPLGKTPSQTPSKIPVSTSRTPQPASTAEAAATKTRLRSASANRGTASKLPAPVSTGRAQRSVSRLKQPSSATKTLTDSALKRKTELDKQRALQLQQQMKEKEEKAARQRQQNLASMVVEHKQKREEKERKVAMTREQLEKEANERRLRESAKKKEAERRRLQIEESRKILNKRQEEAEAERRAAEAAAARRAADEERAKREAQEAEVSKQIRDRIQQIQQQKLNTSKNLSTSLGHRMLASSFVAHNTTATVAAAAAAHTSLTSEMGDSVLDSGCTLALPSSTTASTHESPTKGAAAEKSVPQTINLNVTVNGNATFEMPSSTRQAETMLPPPPPAVKATVLASYDISDLNSEEDSDDERNPRKAIPEWAKGSNFVASLQAQYSKLRKYRDRDIMKTFRLCPTTVDLDLIFKGYTRHVIPKYDKRTSSAHWSSPPASKLNFSDSFWANASFSKSILEQKE